MTTDKYVIMIDGNLFNNLEPWPASLQSSNMHQLNKLCGNKYSLTMYKIKLIA